MRQKYRLITNEGWIASCENHNGSDRLENVSITYLCLWLSCVDLTLNGFLSGFAEIQMLIRSIVSFHRIVKEPLTLSDGLFLPKGTHICLPAGPISKDPAFVTEPEFFDGFRWCQDPKDRHALSTSTSKGSVIDGKRFQPSETEGLKESGHTLSLVPSTSTSFVSISASSMHFGAGRQACPGRFFAGCTIKAIFSKILMDYEFKYEDGRDRQRPPDICVGEHILPNTSTPVLFRKRAVGI